MAKIVIKKNKYARVISHNRGSSYEVQEKVGSEWVRLTEFYGHQKDVAIHTYDRLTKSKQKRRK